MIPEILLPKALLTKTHCFSIALLLPIAQCIPTSCPFLWLSVSPLVLRKNRNAASNSNEAALQQAAAASAVVQAEDDEVQVVGINSSPTRSVATLGRAKRERPEDDEDDESTSDRRVARRISNSKEEQERKLSMTKLVLCLIKHDDDGVLKKALPNLLVALHEK